MHLGIDDFAPPPPSLSGSTMLLHENVQLSWNEPSLIKLNGGTSYYCGMGFLGFEATTTVSEKEAILLPC